MAANDVMFNIGIRVDADRFTTETQAVVSDLQKTLSQNGITVPVNLNNATLKEMDQFIQSIGGSMKITKDQLTGFIDGITVSVPKANGQILSIKQSVDAVTTSITDATGATQQVFQGFQTSGITTTMNGMNDTLERAKSLQDEIVKTAQKRVDIEYQLSQALLDGDAKQQASLMKKLDANTRTDQMARDQLSYLQQQANALGVQVNYFDQVNQKVDAINADSEDWSASLIQNSQDALTLAQNINQSKQAIENFFNAYQKAASASGGDYRQMLVEDFQNMQPAIDRVTTEMENLGVVFDQAGAHYSGNNTALQELVQTYNKAARAADEFNAKQNDQQSDAQQIEQAVQAYKAYRDQLDKVYKLKKENNTSVDIKSEVDELNRLKTAYKQLEQGILSNGEAVYKNTQYNRDKNQVTRDSIQAQKELNTTMQDNTLEDLIAKTIEYKLSLQGLFEVIQNVISETISLNDSMTDIRLVTQSSADDTKKLMSDYSQIAKELGTTTTAVADSAVEWLRQGNTVEETSELVKASTTLSVIGAMDASDATTALTASLNGYKMEAQDAMKIVDQLTTLDLKYATKLNWQGVW